MTLTPNEEMNNVYEAYFPEYGIIRWVGDLPEWIETPHGWVHKSTFQQLAGTRLWEKTGAGWVLSDKHA
jgi:hypothetical protein